MTIRLILFFLPFLLINCDAKINNEDNVVTSKTELLTELADEEDTTKAEVKAKTKTESVTINEESNTEARLSSNLKPLLIARGSEPGWYAEFFKDHLRLLIDYGKDSVFIESDFINIAKAKNYKSSFTKATVNKDKNKVIALEIVMDLKPCAEAASGEKRERTITLKYNGKSYKGCAGDN